MRSKDEIMGDFGKLVREDPELGKAYSNPNHCFGDPDSYDPNTEECVRCAANNPVKQNLCRQYCELTKEIWALQKREEEDKKKKVCVISGCGQPVKARGLCQTHYSQFSRGSHKRVVEKGGKMVAEDHSPVKATEEQQVEISGEDEYSFTVTITSKVTVRKSDIHRIMENLK